MDHESKRVFVCMYVYWISSILWNILCWQVWLFVTTTNTFFVKLSIELEVFGLSVLGYLEIREVDVGACQKMLTSFTSRMESWNLLILDLQEHLAFLWGSTLLRYGTRECFWCLPFVYSTDFYLYLQLQLIMDFAKNYGAYFYL